MSDAVLVRNAAGAGLTFGVFDLRDDGGLGRRPAHRPAPLPVAGAPVDPTVAPLSSR
ncbi:MAG: hypothetical protein ACLFU0_04305 [Alphaproteobacteria bacterium]